MGLNDILSKPSSEIKRPPPIPVGHVTLQIFGRPNFVDQARAQKTDYVDFQSKIVALGDDMSADQIAAFPGGRDALIGHELKGRSGCRFYLSEAAAYMLTEWLTEALGIDPEGKNVKEMCFEAPGHMVIAEIQQEPTQDGKGMVSTIRSYARVS